MSKDQIEKFIEKISNDNALQAEIESAPTVGAVVDIAKNLGFEITTGDILRFQAKATAVLSDSELEIISGGATYATLAWNLVKLFTGTTIVVTGVTIGMNEISKNSSKK